MIMFQGSHVVAQNALGIEFVNGYKDRGNIAAQDFYLAMRIKANNVCVCITLF